MNVIEIVVGELGCSDETLLLGYAGEDSVEAVVFDFSPWAEAYGSGTITLEIMRASDTAPYTPLLTIDGTTARWTISDVDTARRGPGVAQLIYMPDDQKKKSAIFKFYVGKSIRSDEDPDPWQGLLNRLEELLGEMQQEAADTRENAAAADQSAQDAAASESNAEAWAVGKRGGTDVGSTDPAYHNNSKYYAGQAAESANRATERATSALNSAASAGRLAQTAGSYAADARTSAGDAASSATAAAGSASDAATAKTAAETAQTAAAASAAAASTSAGDAASSATAAAGSATSAAGSATDAAASATSSSQSETNAAESETAAAGSASTATTAATAASNSATAAANSATAAGNAKTAAEAAQGKAEDAQEAAEQAKSDAETASQSVSQSAAQISQNASDISDLKSAITERTYNLVVSTKEGRSINSAGRMSINANYAMFVAPVEQGVTYRGLSSLNYLFCGFFTNNPIDPEVDSTTYNNARIIQDDFVIVAPITGFMAIITKTGTKAQITQGTLYHDYLPPITATDFVARANYNNTIETLKNKKLICTGDSIAQANSDLPLNLGGWYGRLLEKYNMTGTNYAIAGGSITYGLLTGGGNVRFCISRSVDTIYSENPDLDILILEGGTNDADVIGMFTDTPPAQFGTWTPNDYSGNYDDETFCGAVENMFYKALTLFPTAKIGFIIPMEMGHTTSGPIRRRKYFDYIAEIAKKWHIPVLDLWYTFPADAHFSIYYDSALTSEENVAAGKFYRDGQHPTSYGYDKMQHRVEEWLLSL